MYVCEVEKTDRVKEKAFFLRLDVTYCELVSTDQSELWFRYKLSKNSCNAFTCRPRSLRFSPMCVTFDMVGMTGVPLLAFHSHILAVCHDGYKTSFSSMFQN